MILHTAVNSAELCSLIRRGILVLGGHRRLKIYGKLTCSSGKRMKKENRVFFLSEGEAINAGFRPCGHCLKATYKTWKTNYGPVQQR